MRAASATGRRSTTRSLLSRPGDQGRLHARPQTTGAAGAPSSGIQRLTAGDHGEGLLYVPAGYALDRPVPLVVLLHGAGSDARSGLEPLLELADDAGLLLLAPDARGQTWDVVRGGFGLDVAAIDALLERVFERFAVDPARVAIGGFSDGASYALSLGLTNGDLFTHIVAFSPGFMDPGRRQGRPRIYVSHGERDPVLPIERCSRRIVPSLRRRGYPVEYREFAGGHAVPRAIAADAVSWLGGGGGTSPRRSGSRAAP